MQITNVRALRGPNIWTSCTALEVTVEEVSPTAVLKTADLVEAVRNGQRLAQLGESCLFPFESLEGASLPHRNAAEALAFVWTALLRCVGCPVRFTRVIETRRAGVYRVVVEYRDESVGRLALQQAESWVRGMLDRSQDEEHRVLLEPMALLELKKLDEEVRLGPSTGAIVQAAAERGIPTHRLNEGSLVLLGWGSKQRRIWAAETDNTSAIAEAIAQDKALTKTLLEAVGVPVPRSIDIDVDVPVDAGGEAAWRAAVEIGTPVVVKPRFGNQGRCVRVNLTTKDQVIGAFEEAKQHYDAIMVEQYIPGDDYRLLVVGDQLVAAARRQPPQVVGDGQKTVKQLVEALNRDPRRSDGHATSLSKVPLDAAALSVLTEQNLAESSVPEAGRTVLLRRNANLSTGGAAIDVTDEVHPSIAERAVEAAKVVGLEIAGIDLVCEDIRLPIEAQGAAIVEVNAAPGLRMHLDPSMGRGRPVGRAIVDLLFGAEEIGRTGRIPTAAVSGTNGKTTTARFIAHILKEQGHRVGLTCTDGIYLDGRRIDTDDCSGPKSARAVLLNPGVDAAVLETARGGILREGLGFDRCDVAVVTNIGEGDHLGISGIETPQELAAVKRTIVAHVSPEGSAVLNAADPLTVNMAMSCPGHVIFFGLSEQNDAIIRHRAMGERAVFVEGGSIIAAVGSWKIRVADLAKIPITQGGRVEFQVENTLAAIAACWSLGVPWDVIRGGVATFVNDCAQVPGRFNTLQVDGATIIADYGHNVDALRALTKAMRDMSSGRYIAVFCCAGDRRDEDIIRQAQILGDHFDEVIIFEDQCNRGRPDGEVVSFIRRGLALGRRVQNVEEVRGELLAIETGLRKVTKGDLIFIQVDQVDTSLAYIQEILPRLRPFPTSLFPRPRRTTSMTGSNRR